MSKSYNMPGWRVGSGVGDRGDDRGLGRLKRYFDYGIFPPIQIAAIEALNGPQDWVGGYRRALQSPTQRAG